MRVLLYPFFGQQQKKDVDKFRLRTCGGVMPLAFVARMLEEEFRWEAMAVLPLDSQCMDENPFPCYVTRVHVPTSNLKQRVNWDIDQLVALCKDVDLVITNHELLPIPLRVAASNVRIVGICGVKYERMFQHAFDASNLVVATGRVAATVFRWHTRTPVSVWETSYNELMFRAAEAEYGGSPRDVDVFFAPRASATNYTHHAEFLEALPLLSDLRVVFGDVTGYLRQLYPTLEYIDESVYLATLFRTKVAVSFQSDLYGGAAIRQACRAGCTPVVLDESQYDFDAHRVQDLDPRTIALAIRLALKEPKRVDVSYCSYQAAWERIKLDLTRFL